MGRLLSVAVLQICFFPFVAALLRPPNHSYLSHFFEQARPSICLQKRSTTFPSMSLTSMDGEPEEKGPLMRWSKDTLKTKLLNFNRELELAADILYAKGIDGSKLLLLSRNDLENYFQLSFMDSLSIQSFLSLQQVADAEFVANQKKEEARIEAQRQKEEERIEAQPKKEERIEAQRQTEEERNNAKTITLHLSTPGSRLDSDSEDIVEELLVTVYSQAQFAQVFNGRNLPLPRKQNADGKLLVVTNFADLADGGIYTGSSDRLMPRVSQVENYILRQNTDFEKTGKQGSQQNMF